jgi:hypothetical protein
MLFFNHDGQQVIGIIRSDFLESGLSTDRSCLLMLLLRLIPAQYQSLILGSFL